MKKREKPKSQQLAVDKSKNIIREREREREKEKEKENEEEKENRPSFGSWPVCLLFCAAGGNATSA
jgi:hypothetical protein